MRLKIFYFSILILFFTLAGGLFYLQIIRGDYFFRISKQNRIRVVPLEGQRGRIFDSQGREVATNRVAFNVMVVPQDIEDRETLFKELSGILDVPALTMERSFNARRFTPFAPVEIASDIPREKAIILEEQRYRFPSVIIEEGFKRYYPFDEIASHVIGYVGMAGLNDTQRFQTYGYSPRGVVGQEGVERVYDEFLRGGDGGLQIEVNSRGQQVRLLGLRDAVPGKDLDLTIDMDLEKIIAQAIGNMQGAAVFMDVKTGDVLGLVSTPGFDLNVFVDDDLRSKRQRVLTDSRSPIFNRATKGRYPPGSVFKIPVAIAALDGQVIQEHTTFDCIGFLEIGGTRFGCTHVHGPQNVVEAIAHSCNIYFYQLALKLGADRMHDYAKEMGLGVLTGIDLPYEQAGFIPSRREYLGARKNWYTGNSVNMSIGQGDVLATPLQLARMMATVARDGVEVQPRVVAAIGGKKVGSDKSDVKKKFRPEIWKIIKKGLRATVTDYSGTAHVLDIPGLSVSGKTGTAQTSGGQEHHAWFAGFVNGPQRTLAFCIFLEHEGSSQHANLVARQILLNMKEENLL